MSAPARFTVIPTGAALGAEVVGFPFADYTPEDIAALRQAWLDHLVLRFRATGLDDPMQIRFSAEFGPPVIHPRQLQQGAHGSHPEILTVSNMKKPDGSAAGDLGDGEVNWHTDTWFKERPPAGSFLRSLRVPAEGGDTHFLNMYMAYDTLPPDIRKAVTGRSIHHQIVYDGRGEVRLGMTVPASDDVRTWPGVDHPIARRHTGSGRVCLFLGGRRHASIVGLPPDESDDLLDLLWSHAANDRFTWMQHWRDDDMVAWDNRCTMHRRDAFDPDSIRLMHRTTAEGERPV
jgi:taurine dioxygenase